MKSRKFKTLEELLEAVDKAGGSLPYLDNYGNVWLIEKMKRVNTNITASQVCVHEWVREEFDHQLNCYLSRHCDNCGIKQRWVTSTGEWINAGKDSEEAGESYSTKPLPNTPTNIGTVEGATGKFTNNE